LEGNERKKNLESLGVERRILKWGLNKKNLEV
jgi:hypothetical protein